jgi:phospholipid/cholesterol/gamma-HCH transport system permease protein
MTPVGATPAASISGPWRWSLASAADGIVLRLAGSWRLQDHLPSPVAVKAELAAAASARRLGFDTREVTAWDSGLLVFVLDLLVAATALGLAVDRSGLPDGVRSRRTRRSTPS